MSSDPSYSVMALEFSDDGQVAISLQREAVLPDDRLIAKIEVLSTSLSAMPRSLQQAIHDFAGDVLNDYARGLEMLPAQIAAAPVDDDDDDADEMSVL